MPLGWVRAFNLMLPRLRARDQLRQLEVMNLALGAGSAEARSEVLDRLRQQSALEVAQPKRTRASVADLRALGLNVVEEA
jgi:hypothetical protein